ncbi:PREDICTED: leucine-rich repeat, immunoglobulin-like domain and transmembrane domain-containing protein 2 [Branchiostoma belcheri]|uniref:Leucine-rich repeat, immunoglobulin-like domain and transmembrane domain-containing protein 2 n=1 Tax=Branchiostoma belcheri TaxID=7741 RepID=A0A6P5AM48_BRABE|nr:PREDICTED: leucine-rich repeat, immunoglobulin-like domain and transmembrane domain-containing protein 2 [Branchiostoma belcheri]
MFAAVSIMLLLQNLAQVSSLGSCWTDGLCARHNPTLKTVPDNLTFSTLSSLILKFNDIEQVTSVPEMPKLTYLDLSYNRLKVFPWSTLHNTPQITNLDLHHNQISRVDAYVDFPRSLVQLSLQYNRIATVPETFPSGANPPESIFYLGIWQNPFRCDCGAEWIARSRRCVTEHRRDGCANTTPKKVKACMLANCDFPHPTGTVVVLDVPENHATFITRLRYPYVLRCNSPSEMKGKFLRDLNLMTCAPPSTSAKPLQTTEPHAPRTTRTQQVETGEPEEENNELQVTISGQMTTVTNWKAPLTEFWKAFTAILFGALLAVLVVINFTLRRRSSALVHRLRHRQTAAGLHSTAGEPRRQRRRRDGEQETGF